MSSGTPRVRTGGGVGDPRPSAEAGPPPDGPVDPFGGYFASGAPWEPPPGGLLDITAARGWLGTVAWGVRTGLYTYQQPLGTRSGARVEVGGRAFRMASSYDYLGLVGHPALEAAAVEALRTYGTGTGGVRLLTGTADLHRAFEARLAAFYGVEAALTFTSGYLANLGAIAALFGPDDLAVLDARAHRSITDGCRLARVPVRFFRHNDADHLDRVLSEAPAARRTLVVAEGVYSMDGDLGPLAALVEVKDRHGAFLMVDEAHALGAVGPGGRGSGAAAGVAGARVDLWTGSLSKALASNGGFVAGRRDAVYYLQHGAAPFFFSAALAPPAVAAAGAALDVMDREPWRHARLAANAVRLRAGLRARGYDTGASASPIVPVVAGPDEAAYRLARRLHDLGVLATAVVHPAVAKGSARLRLCATAAQTDADLDAILDAFGEAGVPGDTQEPT